MNSNGCRFGRLYSGFLPVPRTKNRLGAEGRGLNTLYDLLDHAQHGR